MQTEVRLRVHFGGETDDLKTIGIEVNDKEVLRKEVEIAEYFLNAGGIDFEKLLKKAAELVDALSFQKTDDAFFTDGQALISAEMLAAFLEAKKRKKFGFFSFLIQSRNAETPLRKVSDEIIKVSQMMSRLNRY